MFGNSRGDKFRGTVFALFRLYPGGFDKLFGDYPMLVDVGKQERDTIGPEEAALLAATSVAPRIIHQMIPEHSRSTVLAQIMADSPHGVEAITTIQTMMERKSFIVPRGLTIEPGTIVVMWALLIAGGTSNVLPGTLSAFRKAVAAALKQAPQSTDTIEETSAPDDGNGFKPTGIPQIDAMFTGTKIYSMTGVEKTAADACEIALQGDLFSPLGTDSEGRHVLHMVTPGQDYVALVKRQSSPPFGDALIIVAAYPVDKVDARRLGAELAAM